MMNDKQKTKLTAYALGELSGSEKENIELLLKKDREASQFVDEVKQTAVLLESEFAAEEKPILTEQEKTRLEQVWQERATNSASESAHGNSWSLKWWMFAPLGGLVAAGIAAIVLLPRQAAIMNTQEPIVTSQIPVVDQDDIRDEKKLPPPTATLASPAEPEEAKARVQVAERKKDVAAREEYDGLANEVQSATGAVAGLARQMPGAPAAAPSKMMAQSREAMIGYGKGGAGVDYYTTGEDYDHLPESDFVSVTDHPLSTFSIDVDTASYSNLRRFIQSGSLPPVDAVRIEELINYFPYAYEPPKGSHPFAVHTEVARSPWSENRLVRIALKGREIVTKDRPTANLVFLLDVSGSMADENKLPLLKRAFKLLVDGLNGRDKVSIVVYAGASGLVLPPTSGEKKAEILASLERLEAGGSTNGASGIDLAYQVAKQNFVKGGVNRVILATDGDFNVGTTSRGDLIRLIETKAKEGTFLTVLGLGMGNLKDGTLEQLANKGNGNYAYIDDDREAKKVFVEQLSANLVTIAKDVKIQVEFNPAQVAQYRLLGYENRKLNKEDFNDDQKDAGEIGTGHTVTALYEVVPAGQASSPKVDALKYQPKTAAAPVSTGSQELLTVKLRYKQPEGDKSTLLEVPVNAEAKELGQTDSDFRFATAVASFGMILRNSKYQGTSSFEKVLDWASGAVQVKGQRDTYREEFVELVRRAKELKGGRVNN
ncbi:MAG: VWA domain-containing protein [Bdellovibrionales bacterium]|nr:VWA domain-containing protein [Bdellovibrionales bacterium]